MDEIKALKEEEGKHAKCSYCSKTFLLTSLEDDAHPNTSCFLGFYVGDAHYFCCQNDLFSWLLDNGSEFELIAPDKGEFR